MKDAHFYSKANLSRLGIQKLNGMDVDKRGKHAAVTHGSIKAEQNKRVAIRMRGAILIERYVLVCRPLTHVFAPVPYAFRMDSEDFR